MKQYSNGMKATEFSKKQINVLYGFAKRGELKIEKWVIKDFYDYADYYNFDYNRSAEMAEVEILEILKSMFNGAIKECQALINAYTEKHMELLSIKNQRNADRTLVA